MTTRRSEIPARLLPVALLAVATAVSYGGCLLPDFEKIPGEASSTSGPSSPGSGASGPGSGGAGEGGVGAMGGSGGVPDEGCVSPPTRGEDPCAGKMGTPMVRVPAVDRSEYCIDATEVTAGQYDGFLASMPMVETQEAHCMWNMDFTPLNWMGAEGIENKPVGGVDWCDAAAYCAFIGKRLCGKIGGGPAPQTADADEDNEQWYRACTAGNPERQFPYGPTYDPMKCNGADFEAGDVLDVGEAADCNGGFCGILDIVGNVAEWVDMCDGTTGAEDICWALGGSFKGPGAVEVRCITTAESIARDTQDPALGFRCCAE